MAEQDYMNKTYCLECSTKHANRLEHHLEDLVTSSENKPELRTLAQQLLDNTRDVRKVIDNMRIEEMANKQQDLQGIV